MFLWRIGLILSTRHALHFEPRTTTSKTSTEFIATHVLGQAPEALLQSVPHPPPPHSHAFGPSHCITSLPERVCSHQETSSADENGPRNEGRFPPSSSTNLPGQQKPGDMEQCEREREKADKTYCVLFPFGYRSVQRGEIKSVRMTGENNKEAKESPIPLKNRQDQPRAFATCHTMLPSCHPNKKWPLTVG